MKAPARRLLRRDQSKQSFRHFSVHNPYISIDFRSHVVQLHVLQEIAYDVIL